MPFFHIQQQLQLAVNLNSSSSRRQNFEPFTTMPEPAFFRQFHQKLFFYCINSNALLICTFWRWKSLLRDPSPQFCWLPLLLSLTHTFTLHKQKTARVSPTGLGKGHGGQTSWARLLPDSMVELSVTPPHTVSAWSDRADKAAPVLLLLDLLSLLFLQ